MKRYGSLFFILLFSLVVTLTPAEAALHLVEHMFKSQLQTPQEDFELILLFDNPVNPEKVSHYLSFKDAKSKDIPFTVTAGDSEGASIIGGSKDRIVVVAPDTSVKSGTACTLSLAPGLPDISGNNSLQKKKLITFTTKASLSLLSFEPQTTGIDSSKIILRFNSEVRRRDLRRAISVSPYVYCYPSHINGDYNKASKYYLHGGFKPGKKYRITIADTLKSTSGRTIDSQRVLKVTMPPVTPAVNFIEANRVVELSSRQLVHVAVVNVDNVTCEVVSIPPNLVRTAWYGSVGTKTKNSTVNKIEGTSYTAGKTADFVKSLKSLMKKTSGLSFPNPATDSASDIKLWGERFFCSLNQYESKAFSIPLTIRDDAGKGGTYAVRVGTEDGETSTPYKLFQVTNLSLSVKQTPENILVWVTSIDSGKPVADASIYCDTGELRYSLGKTDSNGLLVVDRSKDFHTVTVAADGDEARMDLKNLNSGMLLAVTELDYAWITMDTLFKDIPSGVQARAPYNNSAIQGKAFTDRGIYKPGDEVNFKAVLRDFSGDEPVVPKVKSVNLEVVGPSGDSVFKEDYDVSEFGSVFGVVPMKTFHKLGTYRMVFRTSRIGSSNKPVFSTVCRTHFELQEFRPPRHKVRVDFSTGEETDERFVGRQVKQNYLTATVKGLYYAGGPVKHGKVSWNIKYAPAEFTVDGEDDYEFKSELLKPSAILEHGEGMLDAKGELKVKIPVPEEVMTGSLGLTVEATVLDFDGRPASATDSFSKRPKILVGTAKHDLNIEMGTVAALKAVVIGPDGKRVHHGNIDVEVMRERWVSIRKRDATGQIRWEGEDVFSREFVAPVNIIDGVATFDFDFRSGGEYLIRFHYKAEDGSISTASSRYFVDGYYYGSDEREKREKLLTMNPDKLTYDIGDVAKIAVRGRRKAATYLVTIERGEVLETRVMTLEEGMGIIEVPIKQDYSPNIYVSVMAPCARSRFPIYSSDADVFKPVTLFGACRLTVKTASKQLNVKLDTEPSDELPLPGEVMTVNLAVTNEEDKPVKAEVALCVVDEGILALTGFQTPTLSSLFAETLLRLKVRTSDLRAWILGQSPGREFFNKPFTGGGGGEPQGSAKIQERKDFNPLAFWKADILTDENGKASVSFKLPDTITSYRVYAVAVDRHTACGTNEMQQKVVKPFYLEPGLPRFAVRGDTFEFNVVLFNKTENSDTATLQVRSTNGFELTLPEKEIKIEPYSSATVKVMAKAVKTGISELTFTGHFGMSNDKVRKTINVGSRLTMVDRVSAGSFEGNKKVVLELPPDMNDIPADELTSMEAVITLTQNPMIKLVPGLKYLLTYPHGCIEQTSSGVMSLAGLRALAESEALPGISAEEVDKYLSKGIERVLSMQLYSGGFSYWPGGSSAHSWGSGIALTALSMAKEAGFDVPASALNKAINYLHKDSADLLKADSVSTRKALAIYSLALQKKADKKLIEGLFKNLDKFGVEAKTLFLLAAKKSGFVSNDDVSAGFNDLVALEGAEASEVEFDPYDFSSTERKIAFILMLACDLGEKDSIAPLFAEMLMKKVGPTGRWRSTHDTGWCLLALARYFEGAKVSESDFEVTMETDGKKEGILVQPGMGGTHSLDCSSLYRSPVIRFDTQGKGKVYYNIAYRIPVTEAMRRTMKQGYSLERTYSLASDMKRNIRVGDIVKVDLNITLKGRGNYLALEDPLPAGLVAVNSKLKTEPAITNAKDEGYGYSWDGWWSFTPQHFELRDDRVLAYRNYTWGTHYTYSYYARAVVSGTFSAPAAKIQDMYRPDRVGFAPSEKIVIDPLKK